jgi:transcriptional regulator with XRE-family HTH domain
MSIGSRVKEARKARAISQKELAAKIGTSQPALSLLESGESQGTTFLARIASILEVNPLWLETGRGSRELAMAPPQAGGGSLNLKAETATELQLLMVYRSANEREREAIDDLVNELRLQIEARARDQVKLAG